MRNNHTIQKTISSLLLLVFVVSITPKTYFHAAFADHTDKVVVCTHPVTHSPCLHQSTINCHFDLLVVTSLYAFKAEPLTGFMRRSFTRVVCAALTNHSTRHAGSKESRGPPFLS